MSADLRAALAHPERTVATLRRLLAEAEQRETTAAWLRRESERDCQAFDRAASNG
jgi:hypothetical protein